MRKMLTLLILPLLVLITSCGGGLSSKQVDLIKSSIEVHNIKVKYYNENVRYEGEKKIKNYQKFIDEMKGDVEMRKEIGVYDEERDKKSVESNNELIQLVKESMVLSVRSDSAMTYDEYIEYCEVHKKDPVIYLDEFNKIE